ncbi:hypothetical protein HFN_1009 [Helicobacter fennelliae MRY12-0050]|uniref:Uncharacterized protein n=1 Tax=Helicobacter fennelliae MRY12-0050 TaxID=1325130 RepID=T1CSI8_9HELI|nr:hypothetical protein HFN_1009 [Helicobacter fennelliae MRY12-0050]
MALLALPNQNKKSKNDKNKSNKKRYSNMAICGIWILYVGRNP